MCIIHNFFLNLCFLGQLICILTHVTGLEPTFLNRGVIFIVYETKWYHKIQNYRLLLESNYMFLSLSKEC